MVDWTFVGRGREEAWQSEEAMSTRGREHNIVEGPDAGRCIS